MPVDKKLIIILSTLFLIIGLLIIPALPYTTSQFIFQSTNADYNAFVNGDLNGKIVFVDGNTFGFTDMNGGSGVSVDTNTQTVGWTDASGVWNGIDLNVFGKNIYADKNLYVTGNVGIGISNPVVPLAVSGSIRSHNDVNYITISHSGAEGGIGTNVGPFSFAPASGLVYVYKSGVQGYLRTYASTGGSKYIYTTHDGTNGFLSTGSTGGGILFQPQGTTKMTLDTNGNLGIGTTAPTQILHVNSTTSDNTRAKLGTQVYFQKTANSNDAFQSAGIGIQTSWTGSANFTSTNSGIYGNSYFSGTGNMVTQNGMWFIVGTSGDNNGSVGTRSGAVAQAFSTSAKPVTNSYGFVSKNMAAYNSPYTTAGFYAEASTNAVGNTKYGLLVGDQSGATNNYAIYTGLGTVRFGGNVGIGTTAPSATLDVNGKAIVRNDLNVTNNLYVDGNVKANYLASDGSVGVTDSTSYWFCTASDCSSTCQVTIKNGLITGCS